MAQALSVETDLDRALRYYRNECSEIETPLRSRAITEEEFKALINLYVPTHRFRLIFELLWFCGMRPREACWLQRDNFNEDFTELGYKVAKPRRMPQLDGTVKNVYKSRIVPIPLDLSIRLKKYWEGVKMVSPFGYLFPGESLSTAAKGQFYINPLSLNNDLTKKRAQLGGRWLQKISKGDHLLAPHSFRRSWITRHLDFTGNVAETARAIGHSDFNVTYQYYQPKDSDAKLQEFLEKSRVPETETEVDKLKAEIAELKSLMLRLLNDRQG